MPAPSKTHATAQRKAWKAELKTVQAAVRKIERDHDKEQARLNREITSLIKKQARVTGACHRETAKARRYIAVLEGRIGLN
jgi:hypothetical protein